MGGFLGGFFVYGSAIHDRFCELLIIAVFLLEEEIDKVNKAVQRFEIESEHLGDKETQKK